MKTLKLTKKYEKYPEYKDSGIEWTQKVPESWDVTYLRAIAKENELKNTGGLNQNLLSLSYGKIITKDINGLGGLLPESFGTYQVVQKGDIVMRLTDLQNDNKSLRVGFVEEKNGIITSAYLVLVFSGLLVVKRFAYYLLHSYDLQKVYYGMGGGVRQTLDFFDFKYLPVLMPDTKVQEEIVSFLDEKTTLIDSVIEKKQKQIEFLKEKRSALINHAVTKGLDPKAKFVDSDIEWIGKIPVGWSVEKLKFVAPQRNAESGFIQDEKYVGLENVESNTGRFIDAEEKVEPESLVNFFRKGDVLFGKLRPYLAKVFLPDFDGVSTGEFLDLVPDTKKACSGYLFYKLISKDFITLVNNSTYGTRMPRANWSFIGNQVIVYPLVNEQKQIVAYLDKKTRLIDESVTKVERAIELLQEFKSSLISHAVTGKIRI